MCVRNDFCITSNKCVRNNLCASSFGAATMAAAQYRESLLEDDRRADAVTVLADDILKFDTVRPK